jgi:predicted Rossmann-fold nucleotide-binding protein
MGTLEELTEILTWGQLGLHARPCGLLDVAGYYDPLIAFFDRAVSEGFLRAEHRRRLLVADDPEALLDRLAAWKPPLVERWIDGDET